MPLRVAEAFILRTYPLRESDKIVSFFTREHGKLRGVARGARRPKSKFGSTLEPLSQVRVQYFEREGRDLCTIDHCDLIASMAVAPHAADLEQSVAVSLILEIAERMLPENEPSDAVFRLLTAVLDRLRGGAPIWMPITYYLYWMVRLGGFLPNFADQELEPPTHALIEGIRQQSLTALIELDPAAEASPGRELRQRLIAAIEDHIEARLRVWPMLLSLATDAGASLHT